MRAVRPRLKALDELHAEGVALERPFAQSSGR
jgi:hypothetical protein